jgi:hypothetical protein
VQGDLILCNAIGFLGIKQHGIKDEGTGYKTEFRHDLLKSSDETSDRRSEFAPDGSLYVIDWHNVLIGHMQHIARDPLRDHVHGRIYRITYPSRPLVTPARWQAPAFRAARKPEAPEYRRRYRSRRALRSHPARGGAPSGERRGWPASTSRIRGTSTHLLEALWTTWGMNQVDEALLRQLLESPDFRVRACRCARAPLQSPRHFGSCSTC